MLCACAPLALRAVICRLRLVKASTVLARLTQQLTCSQKTLKLFKLLGTALLILHAFACVLGISTTFSDSPADSWFGRAGYCVPLEFARQAFEDPETYRGMHTYLVSYSDLLLGNTSSTNEDGETIWHCVESGYMYLTSLVWGFELLTGGDTLPRAGPFEVFSEPSFPRVRLKQFTFANHTMLLTWPETVITLILKIMGAFLWALIFGDLVVSLTVGSDPAQVRTS